MSEIANLANVLQQENKDLRAYIAILQADLRLAEHKRALVIAAYTRLYEQVYGPIRSKSDPDEV